MRREVISSSRREHESACYTLVVVTGDKNNDHHAAMNQRSMLGESAGRGGNDPVAGVFRSVSCSQCDETKKQQSY